MSEHTHMSRPLVRKRNVTLAGATAAVGLAVASIGAAASQAHYLGTNSLLAFAGIGAGGLASVALAAKWKEVRGQIAAVSGDGGDGGEGLPPQMAGDPRMMQLAGSQAQVMRLLHVAAGISEFLVPDYDKFEVEENELVGYGFYSSRPGLLSRGSTADSIFNQLMSSMGSGWNIDISTEDDTISASRKSDVPTLALPEMWRVVNTPAEAAQFFNDFEIVIGVGADGPIKFKPKQMPHREMVGATGGGKSVAARAEIMQYLAAGYRMYAVDGKGTDYAPFMDFPNVVAVSTNQAEHIIVVHRVYNLLMQRRALASQMSKRGDNSWRESMTPVLLVLDEFASVRTNMKGSLTPKENKLFERDIADILKVGREFRVNVLLATQDMKADTVPTDWLDQLIITQSLGQPAPMTISKAFPEQIQGKVRQLGATISRKVPGRALVSVTEESGDVSAQLYQAFWSYSPAEDMGGKLPDPVRANWTQFKSQVADRIPKMYPREWVQVEWPDPPSGKDPYADFRDQGWVDLTQFSVADLHALKPLALDDPQSLEPIPENAKFDPLAEEYIGVEPMNADFGDGGGLSIM